MKRTCLPVHGECNANARQAWTALSAQPDIFCRAIRTRNRGECAEFRRAASGPPLAFLFNRKIAREGLMATSRMKRRNGARMNPSAMRMGMPGAASTAPQSGAVGGAVMSAAQGKGALAAKLAALKAQGIAGLAKGVNMEAASPGFDGEVGMALAAKTETGARINKAKRGALTTPTRDAPTSQPETLAQPDASAAPSVQAQVKLRTFKGAEKTTPSPKTGMQAAINNVDAPKPEPIMGGTHAGIERAAFTPRAPASPEAAARAEKWKATVNNPEALAEKGIVAGRGARAAELRAEGKTTHEVREILRAEGFLPAREGREPREINAPANPAALGADRPQRPETAPRSEKTARAAMNDARPQTDDAATRAASSAQSARLPESVSAALEAVRTRVQDAAAQASAANAPSLAAAPTSDVPSPSAAVTPTLHGASGNAASADAPVNMAPLRDAPQAAVLAELAARIASRLEAGRRVFDIRLDPPEMGSIGVRLEFNADGQMRAMLGADRVEALELLRRDAPELMRMLREAGIDLAGNGLSFSLEDGRNGADQHRETHALLREQGFAPVRAALESEIEAALSPYLPTRALDISI